MATRIDTAMAKLFSERNQIEFHDPKTKSGDSFVVSSDEYEARFQRLLHHHIVERKVLRQEVYSTMASLRSEAGGRKVSQDDYTMAKRKCQDLPDLMTVNAEEYTVDSSDPDNLVLLHNNKKCIGIDKYQEFILTALQEEEYKKAKSVDSLLKMLGEKYFFSKEVVEKVVFHSTRRHNKYIKMLGITKQALSMGPAVCGSSVPQGHAIAIQGNANYVTGRGVSQSGSATIVPHGPPVPPDGSQDFIHGAFDQESKGPKVQQFEAPPKKTAPVAVPVTDQLMAMYAEQNLRIKEDVEVMRIDKMILLSIILCRLDHHAKTIVSQKDLDKIRKIEKALREQLSAQGNSGSASVLLGETAADSGNHQGARLTLERFRVPSSDEEYDGMYPPFVPVTMALVLGFKEIVVTDEPSDARYVEYDANDLYVASWSGDDMDALFERYQDSLSETDNEELQLEFSRGDASASAAVLEAASDPHENLLGSNTRDKWLASVASRGSHFAASQNDVKEQQARIEALEAYIAEREQQLLHEIAGLQSAIQERDTTIKRMEGTIATYEDTRAATVQHASDIEVAVSPGAPKESLLCSMDKENDARLVNGQSVVRNESAQSLVPNESATPSPSSAFLEQRNPPVTTNVVLQRLERPQDAPILTGVQLAQKSDGKRGGARADEAIVQGDCRGQPVIGSTYCEVSLGMISAAGVYFDQAGENGATLVSYLPKDYTGGLKVGDFLLSVDKKNLPDRPMPYLQKWKKSGCEYEVSVRRSVSPDSSNFPQQVMTEQCETKAGVLDSQGKENGARLVNGQENVMPTPTTRQGAPKFTSRSCPAINASGLREGQRCGNTVQPGNEFCGIHKRHEKK